MQLSDDTWKRLWCCHYLLLVFKHRYAAFTTTRENTTQWAICAPAAWCIVFHVRGIIGLAYARFFAGAACGQHTALHALESCTDTTLACHLLLTCRSSDGR